MSHHTGHDSRSFPAVSDNRCPLYLAGAELKHFYSLSTIVDGQGLDITVQSYRVNLDFGVVVDRELIPDVWTITDYLRDSMDELLASI